MIKEVLILFKTHLDVGFTDYSAKVVERYLSSFIPKAIELGYELKDTDTPFIWTVGSWMVAKALEQDKDGTVAQAIRDGIISWHGLPFTTHTELMNETVLKEAIAVSKRLDEKFGIKTTGAKMTDVPGHTLGMIPMLADNGIELLHLGVNPAAPLPDAPEIFKWQCGEKSVTVIYNGDYGEFFEVGDIAIGFAHTGDNLGPQSAEETREFYNQVRQKYPSAYVHAATFNDVAQRLHGIDLPVVDKEIGDTWIHGAGTDPKKVAGYRALLRYAQENPNIDVPEELLLTAEHTWGMDIKTHFSSLEGWDVAEFEKMVDDPARKKVEESWDEQRAYVRNAAQKMKFELDAALEVVMPDLNGAEETSVCDAGIEISWQLFDTDDYERYKQQYMRTTVSWAIWDVMKYGLPEYEGGIYTAKATGAWQKGEKRIFRMEFDAETAEKFGLPRFFAEVDGENVEIKWFGKKPSRLPQAFWLKFHGFKEQWELHKMGQWISPDNIIGSPLICAVDKGVCNGDYIIETQDAPLVAPYGRKLLHYGIKTENQDLYFNLYNNIWNTNFPMWYSDDAKFRFKLSVLK